jgi:hypothetical protein
MDALVHVISGQPETPNPSIVTQISVVWMTAAEVSQALGTGETAAMSAARGFILTTAQDCANFLLATNRGTASNGTGYALSSANLVSGTTYTPSVMVTDSAFGAGSWVRGTAFTPSPTTTTTTTSTTTTAAPTPLGTYDLTSGTLNPAIFGTSLTGATTVAISGGSLNTVDGPADTDSGIVYLKAPVVRGAAATYKLKMRVTGIKSGEAIYMGLMESASYPITGLDTLYNSNIRVSFSYTFSTGFNGDIALTYMNYWSETNHMVRTATPSWSTTSQALINTPQGTTFWYELVCTSTTFQLAIYAADGTTLVGQSAPAPWSDLKSTGGSLYLFWGEPYTNAFSGATTSVFTVVVQ